MADAGAPARGGASFGRGGRNGAGEGGISNGGKPNTSAGEGGAANPEPEAGSGNDAGAAGSADGGSTNAGTGGAASGAGTGGTGVVCSSPMALKCLGTCVDPLADRRHCGGCGRSCAASFACVDGSCGCRDGQTECSASCVDTTTDSRHCGTCANVCSAGKTCSKGRCVCPSGQPQCSGACADIRDDPQNCGVCGKRCGISQACTAGECVASEGGELGPDQCAGLAQSVTLQGVYAYQSVEIPIMRSGAEVLPAARNTDIVVGKITLLRLFYTDASGFPFRQLSGRVFVENDGVVDLYFDKKEVTSSSSASWLDSTFNVTIPAEKIQTTTRYIAEIVECASSAGTVSTPRFPVGASSGAPLGARTTGTLKVELVPLRANGLLPDTSANALSIYRSAALAMYPVSSVELSVGAVLDVPDAQDWSDMLDRVRARRAADAPANDVYYYGLLKPAASEYDYCAVQTSCTVGIGFLVQDGSPATQAPTRAALGLAFADRTSTDTLLHELGHNHGRLHAPCGAVTGADTRFPHYNGRIGVQGWDARVPGLIDSYTGDLMGYCSPRWISDYNYDAILTRVVSLNGTAASELVDESSFSLWRVLLLDGDGARWGIPFAGKTQPHGIAEDAYALDAFGRVVDVVRVYRNPIADFDGASILVPEPKPGWFSVQVAGASPLSF